LSMAANFRSRTIVRNSRTTMRKCRVRCECLSLATLAWRSLRDTHSESQLTRYPTGCALSTDSQGPRHTLPAAMDRATKKQLGSVQNSREIVLLPREAETETPCR